MQYIPSWERKAYNEGKQEGKQEGIQEGKQEGIQEGKQEGIQEGEKKRDIAIAKKMLLDGMPIDTIIKYTDLTEVEIKKLAH